MLTRWGQMRGTTQKKYTLFCKEERREKPKYYGSIAFLVDTLDVYFVLQVNSGCVWLFRGAPRAT